MNKTILLLILGSVGILLTGIFLVSRSNPAELAPTNAAVVSDAYTYDWGEIPIIGGTVSKTFSITNNGDGDLRLANIKTSCMCTTAVLHVNGEVSPEFGMHSSSAWTGVVKPGEKAELAITFDPAFHGPDATGPITREITVETNDVNNPILTYTLSGNVTKN